MQQEKEQAVEDLQVNEDIGLLLKKIGPAEHLSAFSLITVDSFLQNVEAAFADVHRKYERTKQVAGSGNLSWSPLYYDL